MENALTIRHATTADIPALHRLVESAYRGDSARKGWTHEADLLDGQRTDAEDLAGILAAPDQTVLLAVDQTGALHGCVQVSADGPGRALLGMLSVDPERQANGLGRTLIAAAEAHARDTLGAHTMAMTVIRQRAELIAYYGRRGYTDTGTSKPFPYGNERFGVPRSEDLVFTVLEKALVPTP